MARDFRAKQLRTSVIIGSGSIESTKPHLGLVFYSASKASDFEGVRRTGGSGASVHGFVNADGLGDDTTQTAYLNLTHASIGHDVWCVFDGASHGTDASLLYGVGNAAERLPGSTVLFLGDVVVSGSLFAERQIVEVDTTATGDFRTPQGSNAYFDGGFGSEGVDITANGEIKAFTSVRSPIFLNDSANVTLKTTTSGDVDIHPISGITRFKFDADSSATLTVADNSHTTLATAESGNFTLDSAGTVTLDAASEASDAIFINSAGGLDITSVKSLDITATNSTDGLINIASSADHAAALGLSVDGGTSAGIDIVNITGTSNDSINIQSSAGGIRLDAAQNIQLDANGGQVRITDDGSSHFDFDCDNTSFTIYDDTNSADYFKIQVDADGSTTLSTNDNNGESGELILDADGFIKLDSHNGYLEFQKAGVTQYRQYSNGSDILWTGWNGASGDFVFSLESWAQGSTGEPSVRMLENYKLEFHDDSQFIHAPSDNNLTVKANDSITLDAGDRATGDHAGTGNTIDSGAVLLRNTGIHIGGAGTSVGVASVATGGESPIRIFKATQTLYPASQNTDSGHINWPFDGTSGSPVAQAGDLVISNRTSFNGVNANGNIIFDGAVTIANQAVNNLTVSGDLIVQGTTTTLNTEILAVEDPLIILAKDQSGSPAWDAGFVVERGTSSNVAFIWDESAVRFNAITTNDTGTTAGDVAISGYVPISAQTFMLETPNNKIDLATDIIVTAAADITFTAGGGGVTPTANDGAALGSSSKGWSDLYLADGGQVNLGDDQDVTLTHVHNAGLRLNSGMQLQFGDAGENVSGDGTDITIASGGDINLNATADVNIPANIGLTFGNDGEKIEGDGSGMTISGGTVKIQSDTTGTTATRVMIGGDGNSYIERTAGGGNPAGSGNLTMVSNRPMLFDSGGAFSIYASYVNIKDVSGSNPLFNIGVDGSNNTKLWAHRTDADLLLQVSPGGVETEIVRLDASESSLLMAGQNKIQFNDANKYIHYDGTDLTLVSNSDIKLDPDGNDVTIVDANAQLNFNSADHRIYLDSNELKFRDGTQTTPVTLSDLASVSPSPTAILSATGDNRARIMGFTSIDSSNFYLNQASHPANGQDDVFLYVGDDGGTRTNSAFKNNLSVSGSISMVDTADNLSATKFTQTNDNLIVSMNTSTAGNGNATLHNLLTLESASGLKLGTTAGSGNAGLYFQGAGLNLQKINTTVEGSAQDCIQIQGHLLPQTDNSFNLGTASRRFANLYTGDLHLNNMGSSNDVDGTAGNWTIQEGEDNLYVINNLTGKKFKMMLQPLEDGE